MFSECIWHQLWFLPGKIAGTDVECLCTGNIAYMLQLHVKITGISARPVINVVIMEIFT